MQISHSKPADGLSDMPVGGTAAALGGPTTKSSQISSLGGSSNFTSTQLNFTGAALASSTW